MSAESPVDVNRCTLYAIIPGLDYKVASKLNKKKFALIYTLIFMACISVYVAFSMYDLANNPELNPEIDKEKAEIVFQDYFTQSWYAVLIILAIHLPIYSSLVRKWAKEWNMKLDRNR